MLIFPTGAVSLSRRTRRLAVAICLLITGVLLGSSALAERSAYSERDADLNNGTVLVYWASWCGACKPALKQFQKASDANQLSGYKPVAVNIFENDVNRDAYLNRLGVGMDETVAHQFPTASKEVRALPWVVLLDADGNVIADKHPQKSVSAIQDWIASMDELHRNLNLSGKVSAR